MGYRDKFECYLTPSTRNIPGLKTYQKNSGRIGSTYQKKRVIIIIVIIILVVMVIMIP